MNWLRRDRTFWLAAIVLMLGEFLLFDRMTSRHHAGFYPRWNDQIQYLTEAYTAYEKAQGGGFLAGLKQTLTKPALQGTLHDTAALCIFTLVGSASRSAALSLNMLVFLAWQAALMFTVLRLTGSRPLAWIAFALVLSLASPWSNSPGSAVDFRLDHAAMCLMGITACTALLTDGFRRTGASLAFGAAVGLTLLTRFLTGAYFAIVFVALGGWILAGADRWRRLGRLAAAGAIAAAGAGPVFWHNREGIYTYYWIGHIAGAESNVRTPGLDPLHSLQFVFGQFATEHLGLAFGVIAAALFATLALLALVSSRRSSAVPRRSDWLVIAFVFAIFPGLILTLHRQKSEVVLGILAPGTLLLILGLAVWLWDRVDFADTRRWPRLAFASLAAALLAGSTGIYVSRQFAPVADADTIASARTVNFISDRIFETAHSRRFDHPYIAVDQIVDYLDAQILAVTCYERKKVWVNFVIQLPNSILAEPTDAILYKIKLCHFVVLTDEMSGNGFWPYDKELRRLYPQLKTWCDANLDRLESFEVYGRKLTLYAKRAGA
ncbi:MAG: hypothetical protein KF715_06790 [Candidatus Didemnitutus sp.]|nr:hypothetical protein [Candidatus Didemnitutus sp.]